MDGATGDPDHDRSQDVLADAREKIAFVSIGLSQQNNMWDKNSIAGLDKILMEIDGNVQTAIEQLEQEVHNV